MSTVGFITRDLSGTTRQSTFSEGSPSLLNVTQSKDISLNLSASDIDSYVRRGSDLHLVLADGQILVLQNYYSPGAAGGKNLFLSDDGNFVEVVLENKAEGALFASYEPIDISGKWSAYDDMVFLDIDRIEPVIAPLLAAPLFGGLGAGAAAAGVVGAAALVAGGGDGNGGVDASLILPTVDDPDSSHPIGGATTTPVVITGTGTPGAEVEVTLGDVTQTTIINDDGTWEVTFPVTDLPEDGNYETTVHVVDPDDTTHDLDGPTVIIDTTPPEIEVTSGTESTGDIVNGSEQASGTIITGTGEVGATVLVEINGYSHSTTVGGDGSWSVTFDSSEITTGEYSTDVTITATDAFENSATYSETLVVDTIASVQFDAVEGDNMVNAAEASDGITLSGTGENGASISVVFQGVTRTTTVAEDGTWSVDYAASEVASGTYDSSFEVTSTDLVGNTTISSHDILVDTETTVTIDEGFAGADNIIASGEADAGVTLTGNAEAGATVVVEIVGGATRTVTASDNGTWEATFAAGSIAGGEYTTTVNVTSTDLAGNTDSTSTSLEVDTVAGTVTLSPDPIEIDNVINAVESADGVDINGTATPGMTVTVTLGNDTLGTASTQVVADANGNWSTTFASSDIPQGTDTLDITASITDTLGNTTTATGSVGLDTEVNPLTIDNKGSIEGDDIITASERLDGVTLTGTVEPGSDVTVNFGASGPHDATVTSSGTWSVTIPAADIPTGTTSVDIDVNATDTAGNTSTTSHSLAIDTVVDPFTVEADQTSNDVVNQDELNAGFTLQGTVEPGSAVVVTINNVASTAIVDAAGNWSVAYDASDLPAGEYEVAATIVATDALGNSATLTETFEVDTVFEAPVIDQITTNASTDDVTAISIDGTGSTFTVSSLEGDGSAQTLSATQSNIGGATWAFLDSPVPDGTDLVISDIDSLNNTSSTLVVLEDNATTASTLNHAALGGFNIDELDLASTANVHLQLDEATINALSENSNSLTIHSGDSDDAVTVTDATLAGTRNVDGEAYNVYTVGDDGTTLVIDQDISVTII